MGNWSCKFGDEWHDRKKRVYNSLGYILARHSRRRVSGYWAITAGVDFSLGLRDVGTLEVRGDILTGRAGDIPVPAKDHIPAPHGLNEQELSCQ